MAWQQQKRPKVITSRFLVCIKSRAVATNSVIVWTFIILFLIFSSMNQHDNHRQEESWKCTCISLGYVAHHGGSCWAIIAVVSIHGMAIFFMWKIWLRKILPMSVYSLGVALASASIWSIDADEFTILSAFLWIYRPVCMKLSWSRLMQGKQDQDWIFSEK